MKVESNCIQMRLYFDSKQTLLPMQTDSTLIPNRLYFQCKQTLLPMQTDSTSPTAVVNFQLSHRRIIIKDFTYLRYLSKEFINKS